MSAVKLKGIICFRTSRRSTFLPHYFYHLGSFFTTKSTFENISDNLGVMAIYYVFMSLLWFFYLDRLDKDVDKITKEINDKKM